MRNYPRLNIVDFGQELLKSGDLDPVYIALDKMKTIVDERQIQRWLIAYWCFYHCGVACYASEATGNDFWDILGVVAKNEKLAPTGLRWPRGKERRHSRGQQGIKMIESLREKYFEAPEGMIDEITKVGKRYEDISKKVQEHAYFGPWIAFKVADMLERVIGIPVDFSQAEVFMFKDPVEAALMVWRQSQGFNDSVKPIDESKAIHAVVENLTGQFKNYKAPPNNNRPIGLQEIETILCKWKSHQRGHYPLNNDIIEICHGLNEWKPLCKTAQLMFDAMP